MRQLPPNEHGLWDSGACRSVIAWGLLVICSWVFLLSQEKRLKEGRGRCSCLQWSNLQLPLVSLKANAYKVCFHSSHLSFLHNENSVYNSWNRKEEKTAWLLLAEWWCAPGSCACSWEVQRAVLNHVALPVWQVSVAWVEEPTVHYFGWMRLAVTASGPAEKSTHLLISTALHTGLLNAYGRLLK